MTINPEHNTWDFLQNPTQQLIQGLVVDHLLGIHLPFSRRRVRPVSRSGCVWAIGEQEETSLLSKLQVVFGLSLWRHIGGLPLGRDGRNVMGR